jgi:Na+-transporting NADH:ubiquinone oxidoreductase subunit C
MKLFAKNGFAYNAVFMFATTFVFVLPLALLNTATKPLVDDYWAGAKRVAILRSLGIDADQAHPQEALAAYNKLRTFTASATGGLKPVSPDELTAAARAGQAISPLYYLAQVDGQKRIASSFTGLGLWSSISLAIGFSQDLDTITGLRVLVQAETPGLGGRITEDWFMDQFSGKRLADQGPVLSFKTSGAPAQPGESVVDGIAGATITSHGVRDIIQAAAETMRPLASAIGELP